MVRELFLESVKNPRVKAALRVRDGKGDDKAAIFVEGLREVERALASGVSLRELFYLAEDSRAEVTSLVERAGPAAKQAVYPVTNPVMERLAVRGGAAGCIAIMERPTGDLETLVGRGDGGPILACEGIEKPGNLGALVRSSDGAGARGVVCLDGAIDPFQANVIRASLGTVFRIPVVSAPNQHFRDVCSAKGIRILVAATTEGAVAHYDANLNGPVAFVLGEEARGVSEFWFQSADGFVAIPMEGIADSLNVSSSGAVLLYEALRQRHQSPAK